MHIVVPFLCFSLDIDVENASLFSYFRGTHSNEAARIYVCTYVCMWVNFMLYLRCLPGVVEVAIDTVCTKYASALKYMHLLMDLRY